MTTELEQYERDKQKRLDQLYFDLEVSSAEVAAINKKIDELENETYEQAVADKIHDQVKANRAGHEL